MNSRIKLALSVIALLTACTTVRDTVKGNVVPCRDFGRIRECVAVPMADDDADKVAKQFGRPNTGLSRIYVVRPNTTKPKEVTEVFVDGHLAGVLGPLTYLVLDIPPGKHDLRLRTEVEQAISLSTEANKSYYVRYHLNMLFNRYSGVVQAVDAEEGKTLVMRSRRAATAAE